jgi:hypothetical protein
MAETNVDSFSLGFADFWDNGEGHAQIHVVPRKESDQLMLPNGIRWVLESRLPVNPNHGPRCKPPQF